MTQSNWRTGGPGSPADPGSGDGKATVPAPSQPAADYVAAAVTQNARPGLLRRFWQYLKDQQGPVV